MQVANLLNSSRLPLGYCWILVRLFRAGELLEKLPTRLTAATKDFDIGPNSSGCSLPLDTAFKKIRKESQWIPGSLLSSILHNAFLPPTLGMLPDPNAVMACCAGLDSPTISVEVLERMLQAERERDAAVRREIGLHSLNASLLRRCSELRRELTELSKSLDRSIDPSDVFLLDISLPAIWMEPSHRGCWRECTAQVPPIHGALTGTALQQQPYPLEKSFNTDSSSLPTAFTSADTHRAPSPEGTSANTSTEHPSLSVPISSTGPAVQQPENAFTIDVGAANSLSIPSASTSSAFSTPAHWQPEGSSAAIGTEATDSFSGPINSTTPHAPFGASAGFSTKHESFSTSISCEGSITRQPEDSSAAMAIDDSDMLGAPTSPSAPHSSLPEDPDAGFGTDVPFSKATEGEMFGDLSPSIDLIAQVLLTQDSSTNSAANAPLFEPGPASQGPQASTPCQQAASNQQSAVDLADSNAPLEDRPHYPLDNIRTEWIPEVKRALVKEMIAKMSRPLSFDLANFCAREADCFECWVCSFSLCDGMNLLGLGDEGKGVLYHVLVRDDYWISLDQEKAIEAFGWSAESFRRAGEEFHLLLMLARRGSYFETTIQDGDKVVESNKALVCNLIKRIVEEWFVADEVRRPKDVLIDVVRLLLTEERKDFMWTEFSKDYVFVSESDEE
ncbi:hypothetical protein VKT23_019434 [Stygiomarasmius scandens]|uniref:Uncharacterized protein n=1 Tax=Marasmiellus scandens TaxID=2682957 RepID=A0ABR1ILH7_9AGAR